jgi:hypothetical protein
MTTLMQALVDRIARLREEEDGIAPGSLTSGSSSASRWWCSA